MAAGGNKAAIAIGLGAAAAAIVALSGGGVHAAEADKPKKLPPKKTTSARVSLAKKFAKLFKVPSSLVLAAIYAQSGNKANAYRANKRGGSWGYGQMTLTTAKEIYPRARAKLGKAWDGTGKGLLDPAINIGLTAAYLGTYWARYKKNQRNWMLTAYAYVLGPGRVRAVVPDDSKGKPPKPLPADFARVKARFVAALKQSDVKRALAEDLVKPDVSGIGAEPLSGKALANTIPATTTGYQARNMFGLMTGQLANAYRTLDNYDSWGIAEKTGIDAGSVKAARQYLDSTNSMLSKYYAQMPESSNALTSDQLTKLKAAVSTSSVAVKTVDDLFGTSFWKELGGEIVNAAKTVAKAVNEGIGFSAGMIAAGAVGVGFLILAIKK
jgi:hypothetical protein